MLKYNNDNSRQIILLFSDISDIISTTNIKAHKIEIKGKIFEELIKNVSKHCGNTEYLDMVGLFGVLDLEEEFDKLAIIRNDKINFKKTDYLAQEKELIKLITDNPLIKAGNGINIILNYDPNALNN